MKSKYPWARIAYKALFDGLKNLTVDQLKRAQYCLTGFVFAIQIWALSSVKQLGERFDNMDKTSEGNLPLILQWLTTKSPSEIEVRRVTRDGKVKLLHNVFFVLHVFYKALHVFL